MPRINGMLLTKDADIKTMQSLRSDYIYFKDKLYFEMPENSSLNFTYLQDSYLTELQIKDTLVNLDGKRAWGRLLGESSNFVDISSKIVSNNFEVADFLYAKKTRTGLVILGSVINKNTLLNADGIHENNKLVEGISDTLDLLGVRTMNETASTSEPYYFSYLIFCKDTNQANNFSSLYLAPENNYNIPSGTKHLLNAFFPLPNDLFGENFEIV